MWFKALSLLLTIGAVLAVTPMDARIQSDSSLMDIMMMMPRNGDPQLQQYCFDRYLPLLKGIMDDYETDSKGCQSVYDTTVASIDSGYTELRRNVTDTAKNSCQYLQKCDGKASYLDAFDCFGQTVSKLSEKYEMHTNQILSFRVTNNPIIWHTCQAKLTRQLVTLGRNIFPLITFDKIAM